MITIQHTQESLSLAYVHALSGMAGINCVVGRIFDYGVDGTFRPVVIRNNKRIESGFPLDFQLKCTHNWEIESDNIAYNLKTKNYNDLVTRDPDGIGMILVLLCIPKEQETWATFSEDSLLLQKCCYYSRIEGEPVENENSTKKVLIPRANLLTADSLITALGAERSRMLEGA